MSEKGLDDRDLAILSVLEEDSRIPWARIAKLLGVSEATIYLRVKRLQELGILEGFTIRVNPYKLGFNSIVFVLVSVGADSLDNARREIPKIKYVAEVHETTGPYQFLVKILAPNHVEAAESIDAIAAVKGVKDINTIYSMRTLLEHSNIVSRYIEWSGRARA
ncbi:MAG: Lrp/AsnC family transcriptional regulator [Desulfurococcales archaeon]|nr:Lrp/AsnC family transcriptional regulator [Desulfurococcales archaeon]